MGDSPAGIDRIEIIRSGQVLETVAGELRREIHLQGEIHDLLPGEYLYVRVVQDDGGMAWSSPFFVD